MEISDKKISRAREVKQDLFHLIDDKNINHTILAILDTVYKNRDVVQDISTLLE